MSRDEWEQSITTWWNEHKAMLRFVLILRLCSVSDVSTLMLCCLHQIYKGNNVRRDWKNYDWSQNETVVSRLLYLLKQYAQGLCLCSVKVRDGVNIRILRIFH